MIFSTASDQFFSSWRLGPNQTLSILHDLFVQLYGLGRAQLLHESNRKPTDFSGLILTLATTSYFLISFFTTTNWPLSCNKQAEVICVCSVRGAYDKFPDFFPMRTFIDSTLFPFEVISFGCNALVVPFQQLQEGPMEVILCDRVNDLRQSLFHLINCLITTTSELRE